MISFLDYIRTMWMILC